MKERKKRTTAGDKTICLPISDNVEYENLVKDTPAYHAYLDEQTEKHPELFPADIAQGYSFHGFVESVQLGLTTRRIRLRSNGQAYQLQPYPIMPYMIGKTEDVEKGLYLRRYGVPYDGNYRNHFWTALRALIASGKFGLSAIALSNEFIAS